jgi:hypothetical protein
VGWEVPTSEAWCSSTVATRVRFAPSGRIHRDSGLSGWCQWWGVLSRCPRQPTCRTGKLRGTSSCLRVLQVASDCHWFHVNQRSKQGRVYHASACLDSLSPLPVAYPGHWQTASWALISLPVESLPRSLRPSSTRTFVVCQCRRRRVWTAGVVVQSRRAIRLANCWSWS